MSFVTASFAPAAYVFDGGGDKLMTADFNGDGNLDIAAGATTQTIETALLLGNGDGTFQAVIFPSNLSGFGALFTAGLTNDGHADLVSRNQVALGNMGKLPIIRLHRKFALRRHLALFRSMSLRTMTALAA
jgi:hypothetical protein